MALRWLPVTFARKVKIWKSFNNLYKSRISVRKYAFVSPVSHLHRSFPFFGVKGTEIKMPSLSPTMTEGTIVKWLKKEGETIQPGDVICEIQTDKAVVAFEMEEEGVLAKILMPDDSKDIKVGSLIGLLVEPGEDWQNVEAPTTAAAAVAPSSPAASAPSAPVAAPTGGSVKGTEVKMPSLSPTMTEGTIVKWLKKEGDKISPGDVICEVQTDKAVVAFEMEEEGILAKILVPDDTKDVKIGTLIALTVEEGEDWKDVQIPAATSAAPPSAPTSQKPTPQAATPVIQTGPALKPRRVGPAAKTLLLKYGLNSDQVMATGPHATLTKIDITNHVSQKKAAPQAPSKPATTVPPVSGKGDFIDVPLTNMRRTIAKRLTLSKSTIPFVYYTVDVKIDEALNLRKKWKSEGISVSVNDFIIKAAAAALVQVPEMNVTWNGDTADKLNSVDISVAVATESGLITPIVKNADSLGIEQISATVKELAKKARSGKLQPHEFQGGSFSISNLGMYGITQFTAIINPPQAAILAIGGSRAIMNLEGEFKNHMYATLSCDGRAIENDSAARFLEAFRDNLENPLMALVNPAVSQAAANS